MEETLWVEKYRPKKVADCILPAEAKKFFTSIVEKGVLSQHLLLQGDAGTGKTTIAKALCNDLDLDYLFINASESGNIDTLRTTIRDYASSMSFDDKPKVVLLDEADYLNAQSTQPALRAFMEEFSANCRFVLTCNFKERILEPLQSRCSFVSFSIPREEKAEVAKQFMGRIIKILKMEEVEYDQKAVTSVLKKFFPDYRRILNELQRYSNGGTIDQNIVDAMTKTPIAEVLEFVKEKQFNKMTDWVEACQSTDRDIITAIWNARKEYIVAESFPELVILSQECLRDAASVQNQKINLAYYMTNLMLNINLK